MMRYLNNVMLIAKSNTRIQFVPRTAEHAVLGAMSLTRSIDLDNNSNTELVQSWVKSPIAPQSFFRRVIPSRAAQNNLIIPFDKVERKHLASGFIPTIVDISYTLLPYHPGTESSLMKSACSVGDPSATLRHQTALRLCYKEERS